MAENHGAVRKEGRQIAAMSDATHFLNIRQRRVIPYRRHGPIYNWLRAHHDAIAPLFADETATWAVICQEMLRQGVTSRDGLAPSTRAASKAWQAVVRDVAGEGKRKPETAERVGAVPPSRLPKHWRPAEVKAPPTVTGAVLVTVPSKSAARQADIFTPPGQPSLAERKPELLLTHEQLEAFLKGELKILPDDYVYDWKANLERIRGEMNLRSGLPWGYRSEDEKKS